MLVNEFFLFLLCYSHLYIKIKAQFDLMAQFGFVVLIGLSWAYYQAYALLIGRIVYVNSNFETQDATCEIRMS